MAEFAKDHQSSVPASRTFVDESGPDFTSFSFTKSHYNSAGLNAAIEIVRRHPDDPAAHVLLARHYGRLQSWRNAVTAYDEALTKPGVCDELRASILEERSMALSCGALGHIFSLGAAAQAVGEALPIVPPCSPMYWYGAEVFHRLGDLKTAAQLMKAHASERPDDPFAQHRAGEYLIEAGDLTNASAAYGRALDLNAKDYHAHFFQGAIAYNSGCYDLALKHLRTAQILMTRQEEQIIPYELPELAASFVKNAATDQHMQKRLLPEGLSPQIAATRAAAEARGEEFRAEALNSRLVRMSTAFSGCLQDSPTSYRCTVRAAFGRGEEVQVTFTHRLSLAEQIWTVRIPGPPDDAAKQIGELFERLWQGKLLEADAWLKERALACGIRVVASPMADLGSEFMHQLSSAPPRGSLFELQTSGANRPRSGIAKLWDWARACFRRLGS